MSEGSSAAGGGRLSNVPPAALHVPKPCLDIFVSYASQDTTVANAIVETLELNGIRCWIAPRDVTPGSHYADGIMLAISGAKALVLILSASALASKHVGKEVERVSSKGRPIIVLRTDAAPLTPAFEYFLSESQWMDVRIGGVVAITAKLVEAIRLHVDFAAAGEPSVEVSLPVTHRTATAPRARSLVAVSAVVLSFVLAYFFVDRLWIAKHFATRKPVAAIQRSNGRVMLAVLPFQNLSNDPEQDYLSDGLTEETIADLGELNPQRLGVIARTSAMAYKHTAKTVATIGHELNADYLLEGSIRREGQSVRVTAQLIRVSDQSPLWTHNYDREFTGLLAMHKELGGAIAQQVRVNLAPNYANQPAAKYVPNAEAYELYLQGLFYLNMRTADSIRKSIEYFKRSADKDTGFALAYAGQASAYISYTVFSPQESYPKAAAAALRALELDDGLAEAHAALGAEKALFEFDWAAAETQLNRAIELNPNSAYAHFIFSLYYLTPRAQSQQSILEMKKVLKLDPLSPIYNTVLGLTYYFARQYDQALEQYGKTLKLYPDFFVAHAQLAWLYAQLGDFPNAITQITKTRLLEGGSAQKVAADELAFRKAFKNRGAEGFWQAVRGAIQPGTFDVEVFFAPQIFARLGDTDIALDTLQRSYEQRVFFANFIKVDPAYDSLRSDPRFANLVQRMGLAP